MSLDKLDMSRYIDDRTEESGSGASALLAMEVFADGVIDGMSAQMRHAAAKPWDTISTVVCGGLAGLYLGATLEKSIGQRLAISAGIFATLDVGARTANAIQISVETMNNPTLYPHSRALIAEELGKPLFNYGVCAATGLSAGALGYYKVAKRANIWP